MRIALRMIAQEVGLLLGILTSSAPPRCKTSSRRTAFVMIGGAVLLASCGQRVSLSDAARTACGGQEAANVATDAANRLGNVKAAELASATSAYLGLLCKW